MYKSPGSDSSQDFPQLQSSSGEGAEDFRGEPRPSQSLQAEAGAGVWRGQQQLSPALTLSSLSQRLCGHFYKLQIKTPRLDILHPDPSLPETQPDPPSAVWIFSRTGTSRPLPKPAPPALPPVTRPGVPQERLQVPVAQPGPAALPLHVGGELRAGQQVRVAAAAGAEDSEG